MALQVIEFFGYTPLDPAAAGNVADRQCPFVGNNCIKPNHGACSVRQVSEAEPVICCPNRMYADHFKILTEIAAETFGAGATLVRPADVAAHVAAGSMTGNEVAVFGRYWGQELALATATWRGGRGGAEILCGLDSGEAGRQRRPCGADGRSRSRPSTRRATTAIRRRRSLRASRTSTVRTGTPATATPE